MENQNKRIVPADAVDLAQDEIITGIIGHDNLSKSLEFVVEKTAQDHIENEQQKTK